MSLLIDPPLLYAAGRVCAGCDHERAAGTLIVATFWGVSVPLYLDRAWTRPLWRACGARSGRDFMLGSGLLRLDWRRAGAPTHAVAAAVFATYPLWFLLGLRHGRR